MQLGRTSDRASLSPVQLADTSRFPLLTQLLRHASLFRQVSFNEMAILQKSLGSYDKIRLSLTLRFLP